MRPSRFPAPKHVPQSMPKAIKIASKDCQAQNFAKAGVVGEKAPTFYPDAGAVEKAGGRV